MPKSIPDHLSFEIKKEIADRYFGFRKLIEEDKLDLDQKIKQYSFILEKRISFDLIRIYILLNDEELIHAFLSLTGLEEELFYDPYLTQSPTIKARVLEGVHLKGLTKAGRFKKLVFDCYERLVDHVDLYREKIEELKDLHDNINEEIKIFYKKNDLGTIMGFLRSLGDATVSGGMEGGMEVGVAGSLDKKMRIEPHLPIEYYLPIIPPLAPLGAIRSELKKLINRAYHLHDEAFLATFKKKTSWSSR